MEINIVFRGYFGFHDRVDLVAISRELLGGSVDVIVVRVWESNHHIVGGGGSAVGLLLSGKLHLGSDSSCDFRVVGLHRLWEVGG